jgi:preprotein translocase subunit YajC
MFGAAGGNELIQMIGLPVLLIGMFYLMIMRPQQQQLKRHRDAIAAIKRNDTVVLSSGMIGKVVRVEDAELGLEIATGVTVKVVKDRVAEVRTRGAPAAANDAKS